MTTGPESALGGQSWTPPPPQVIIRIRFEAREFGENYRLGDSGYPLKPYLWTPLLNPRRPGEIRYSRSHTRTRVIIEQTFGILKSRFKCLQHSGRTLQYDPVSAPKLQLLVCFSIPIPQEIVENDGEMNIVAEAAESGTTTIVKDVYMVKIVHIIADFSDIGHY
ncbi:putative nuclease HARBI1 [Penaeus monodon]|uniref:putative nuclease HARBI1 n=1 Tax=Penaeus monodon TaxID=6687 RepID=UPI0018A75470|nr:putative nuclease HARBI1 [Penaeus monodon]